jgi:repressor LexA
MFGAESLLPFMNTPTPRQQQVLDFIRECLDAAQPVPSVREIARQLKLSSPSSAQGHLEALRRKGWLEKTGGTEGAARSLRLKGETAKRVTGIPLLGGIPAGLADLRSQEPDGLIHVDVESLKIPRSSRIFALKVTGDSMIGKQIMDGDIVIMEQNAEPKPGDVVAALIDGQSTLKTYLLDRGRPFLRAENPRYPNLIPLSELMIQGVMRMLVRTPSRKKS